MRKTNEYWCSFKILGGGIVRLPYNEIRKIVIDPENLRTKLYIKGEGAPTIISNNPEEIKSQTEQTYERDPD